MKKSYNYIASLALGALSVLGFVGKTSAQSNILATAAQETKLFVLDTTNYNILNSIQLAGTNGEVFNGVYGLFQDNQGDYYAAFTLTSSSTSRILGKIDINSGLVTLIDTLTDGNTFERFSGFTNANGKIYGVTGAGSTTPEALYTINTADASITLVDTIDSFGSSTGYGAGIGYCPDNQMVYIWAGDSLYKVDPVTDAITYIAYDTTGTLTGQYTHAMHYIGNGQFLVNAYYTYGDLLISDTLGNITAAVKAYDGSISNIRGWSYVNHNDYSITAKTATTFCLNDPNGVLFASLVGDGYQWMLNGDTIVGDTNMAIMPTVSGIYNCFVNVAGVMDSASTGINVKVNPLPVVTLTGDTILCAGDSVKLIATGGGTLQWYMDGDSIIGASSATYYALTSGVYNLTKTNTNGCADSAAVGIVITEYAKPTVMVTADDADFCLGGSTVIRASGADVYTWSYGGSADTLFVMPTMDSTFTVTGIDTVSGCWADKSVMITVYSLPNVTITADDVALCNGDSTVLRAMGADMYVWNDMSTEDTLKVIPSITTTYDVIGTDINGCVDTAAYVMIVSGQAPLMSIATVDTIICVGNSADLYVMGSDFVSFVWSDNSTDTVLVVSPIMQANYSLIGYNGCGSDTAFVTVDVNPVPTVNAGSDANICYGTYITFTSTAVDSVMWDNGIVEGVPFMPAVGSTNYVATVLDSNMCSNTDTVNVTVNALPVISFTLGAGEDTLCVDATAITLSATPANGTFSGMGVTGTSFDPANATSSADNLIVYTYTDNNGCVNSDSASIYVDVCSGINTVLAKKISVYPNPAVDVLNVKLGNIYATVTLMDMTGRAIESKVAQGIVNFNFSNLSNGMYLIKVQSDKEVVEYKITKQ